MQEVGRRIYAGLLRPDQTQLPYEDVTVELNDILRGYDVDQMFSPRESRTVVALVVPEQRDIDYLIRVADVPDYEEERLEWQPSGFSSNVQAWFEIQIVPLVSWTQHYTLPRVSACFYGSQMFEDGKAVKFNLSQEQVASAQFRLTYRMPLLRLLQIGDRPPLPSDFVPMLVLDGIIACGSKVQHPSDEWIAWWTRERPVFVDRLLEWRNPEDRGRWQRYLAETKEPPVQDMRPFNAKRMRRGWVSTRGYVPRQG